MGETFDPNLHQAVQTVPASEETPANTIVEVLQKGVQITRSCVCDHQWSLLHNNKR